MIFLLVYWELYCKKKIYVNENKTVESHYLKLHSLARRAFKERISIEIILVRDLNRVK